MFFGYINKTNLGVGEGYNNLRKNKKHKYLQNRYVEGYVPGDEIRPVNKVTGDIIISNPIVVENVVRPKGVQFIQNLIPTATSADGDYASMDQISNPPMPGTYIVVVLNGRVMKPAVDAADTAEAGCYFVSSDGLTIRNQGEVQIGDRLKWIGTNSGTEIEIDDELLLIYEI